MRRGDSILVKALLSMKSSEAGGRKTVLRSGYRPNHVFEHPEGIGQLTTYIGEISFDDRELIEPGEAKIATVRFIIIPEIEKYMYVGREWFICDGGKVVGVGEILEIRIEDDFLEGLQCLINSLEQNKSFAKDEPLKKIVRLLQQVKSQYDLQQYKKILLRIATDSLNNSQAEHLLAEFIVERTR